MAAIGNNINISLLKLYLNAELGLSEAVEKIYNGLAPEIKKLFQVVEGTINDLKKFKIGISPVLIETITKIRDKVFETVNKFFATSSGMTQIGLNLLKFDDVSDCFKYLNYIRKICNTLNIQNFIDKLKDSELFRFIQNEITRLLDKEKVKNSLQIIENVIDKIQLIPGFKEFLDRLDVIRLYFKNNTDDNDNEKTKLLTATDERYVMIENEIDDVHEFKKMIESQFKTTNGHIKGVFICELVLSLVILFMLATLGVICFIVIFYMIKAY
jgi:hypothetical protein